MKPLVIFHKNCMDGAGAALVAWLKFGDEAEYRPAQYGDPAPTSEEVSGRDVYVLDFSYPRAELERIWTTQRAAAGTFERAGSYEYGGKLVVLDHHKTAQADLAGLAYCTFDMNRSGALLAWAHFFPNEPTAPTLLLYIQDRDLWRWTLPDSKEISAALAHYGCHRNFRNLIPFDQGQDPRTTLVSVGRIVLEAQRQQVEQIAVHAAPITIDGHKGLAVNSPILQSEIGEALAIKSGTFGAVWYYDEAKTCIRVSLRSRNDFDVSVIAKARGGGGHAQAAGYKKPISLLRSW